MRRPFLVVIMMMLAGFGSAVAGQQDLKAEKTVKYRLASPVALDVRVGPMKVSTLTVTVGGAGGVGAALKAKMSRMDPATQTVLQFAFDAENPATEEWRINYSVEFLDAKGEVIDRFSSKGTYTAEAKTSSFEHVILKAVLPLIDKIRIKFQAAME